jgi:LSD1 subclass zinc finger protein
MSDEVACPCGQRIRLALNRAARRVRCPTCQTVLEVPDELRVAADDDGPEVVAVVEELTCRGCRKRWPKGTALCIDCGHDFRSGRTVRRRMPAKEESVDMGFTGFLTTTRFTVRRDDRGKWWLVKKSWFLFFGLKPTEFPLADYPAVATDYADLGDDHHMYYLYLEGRRGPRRIWSGTSDDKMRELIDALRNGPGLTVRRM